MSTTAGDHRTLNTLASKRNAVVTQTQREFVGQGLSRGSNRIYDETPRRGSYQIDLAQTRDGGQAIRQSRGLVVGYPDELRLRPTDTETLKRIAEVSGGGFEPTPTQLMEKDDRTARQGVPLWPYLLMTALGLYIADVGLRRIELRS